MISFSNFTAIITGASGGIGAATATKLHASGANVVLCARSADAIEGLAAELGDRALAVRGDVSRYTDVEAVVAAAVERFGNIDLLVNNAGTIEPIARLEDANPDAWSTVVDVNLKGVFYAMHAVHPHMQERGGTIVNISSGAATNALEGWSHYCATKAGVLALTRCGHKEWAEQGIHVVGLSPGTVATPMQTAIRDSGVNPVSEMPWSSHISPEWVATAIIWLTQPAARSYDGGDFSLKTAEGRRAVGLE